MAGPEIGRRAALTLGGAAVLAPAAASAATGKPACGVLVFDPASPQARTMAKAVYGQRLVALEGDPVRLWRAQLADAKGPVGGITSWADFLILRGLAAEQGLRVVQEDHVPVAGKAMLVRWTAA